MTKIWGPMAWMTLHSISLCYPETPTENDKKILNTFIDSFARTITCMNCRDHFYKIFNIYKKSVTTWADSREELFLAICRLHNTVNQKLDKPSPKTVEQCLLTLKTATMYTSFSEFRKKYIEYLFRDWRKQGYANHNTIALNSISEMQKINEQYWNVKEVPLDSLNFPENNVLTYPNQPIRKVLTFPPFSIKKLIRKMKQ